MSEYSISSAATTITPAKVSAAAVKFRLSNKASTEAKRLVAAALDMNSVGSWPHDEMAILEELYRGGSGVLTPTYFPTPESWSPADWQKVLDQTALYVNLLKTCTHRLVTSVLGGTVRRRVISNPYQSDLEPFVTDEIPRKAATFLRNKVLYGTGVAVPTIKDGRLELWTPTPARTYLVADDSVSANAVVNVSRDNKRVTWCSAETMGWATADGQLMEEPGPGFMPATIGYGEDFRDDGHLYGLSLVRDAARATIRVTWAMMNVAFLQKTRTRSLLKIIGRPASEGDELAQALGANGVIAMKEGGDVKYETPDSNIVDSLEVVRASITALSISVGIPIEDLHPGSAGIDVSAEGARRRAMPLVARTKEISAAHVRDEKDLVLRATGLWAVRSGRAVPSLGELSKSVSTDIDINPTILPESNSERLANELQLLAVGARTDDDFARLFNEGKSEEEIAAIVEAMKERRASAQAVENARKIAPGDTPETSETPGETTTEESATNE